MQEGGNTNFNGQPNFSQFQNQSPVVSQQPIYLNGDSKKSKKPLIIIFIIIILLAIAGIGIWWYFSQNEPKPLVKEFLEYQKLIQQDSIDIEAINTAYEKYYSSTTELPPETRQYLSDYDQVYQFFYNYQKSDRPSRADIAAKYLKEGRESTTAYYQQDYQIFKDKTDEYSTAYYTLRVEQLDILMRLFASYDEAGCLANFISGHGCANVVNIQISDEEYFRLPKIDQSIRSIVRTNQKDLISGADDVIVLLEGSNV